MAIMDVVIIFYKISVVNVRIHVLCKDVQYLKECTLKVGVKDFRLYWVQLQFRIKISYKLISS